MPAYAIFLFIVYGLVTAIMLIGFFALIIPQFRDSIKNLHTKWKRRHLKVVKPIDNVVYLKDRTK